MTVHRLTRERAPEAVGALCEAFSAYPTVRYILGPASQDYSRRLHSLTNFLVMARFLRDEPVLAVSNGRDPVMAVATVTLPGDRAIPPALALLREDLWNHLGPDARERYQRLGTACSQFVVDGPHCHLNMIGVRPAHVGLGLARLLLDSVHELSRREPSSCGVTLNTEDPNNLAFYRHFGYEELGRVQVSNELETWGFFRPDHR